MLYQFSSELPSGTGIEVEAEITPFIPAHTNCLPEDAYPAEGGDAEIIAVMIPNDQGGQDIDLEGLYMRRTVGYEVKFYDLLDELAEEAYDKWASDQ